MKRNARHLPEKIILRGKYRIEDVLGEGGFGITYLATDLDLERQVAIKEYCPREYASRDVNDGITIIPFDDAESADLYQREKEKFIQEARRLAKFYNLPGVVSVLDYFSDYGTAYLVMDYIEGVTISEYMRREGKQMTVEETLTLMKPVMESLMKMHAEGIMHRDISPDNIMITNSGDQVVLIDFGTARSTDIESNRSLSVYKKGGFTPLEQQSTHGNQGPWTDVYELCATIYKCITGRIPQEAVDRVVEDDLVAPSACGVAITPAVEQVLLDGLAIRAKDRIQTMEELEKRFDEAMSERDSVTMPVAEELPETVPVKAEPKPLPKVEPKPLPKVEPEPLVMAEPKGRIKAAVVGAGCLVSAIVLLLTFLVCWWIGDELYWKVSYDVSSLLALCEIGGVSLAIAGNVLVQKKLRKEWGNKKSAK